MRLSVFLLTSLFCVAKSAIAQNNSILPVKLKTTVTLKTPVGVAGQANGLKTGIIKAGVDTAIRVNLKMAYISFDIADLTGSTQMDILSGAHLFWVFDKAGKQVNIPAKVLYSVKASMGENTVNMSVRVPYRLKTDKNIYTVHYRWESKDKARNIDMLTSK